MGGNKACCISRGAPSPDGIAPRPVVIAADSEQPGPPHQADKPPVLSWPSRSLEPEDLADLSAIFDEAVDASDGEGKGSIISNRFSQVRIKLRKHLSRDSGFSVKRASRSSQGNSDESNARREELKRMQKKRIEDELKYSEEYDEDARSVGLSALGTSSRRVSVSATKEVSVLASPASNSSRRHSFSATEKTPTSRDRASETGRRRRSSVPDMPPEPTLRPKKLPSIDDSLPRRSSWRLSFSSSRRASQLRALSQDHASAVFSEADEIVTAKDDQGDIAVEQTLATSPPTTNNYLKWLRGQGLRLPSPYVEINRPLEHLHVPGAHPEESGTPEPPTFGGVDGQQEDSIPYATRLHHLHISERLASSTKAPLSQASSSRQPSFTSDITSEDKPQSTNSRVPRKSRNTSSSGLTESKIPKSWGEVLEHQLEREKQDGSSSLYFSNASQRTATPGRPARQSMPISSETNESADATTGLLVSVPAVVLTQPDEATPISITKQRPVATRSASSSPRKGSLRKSESDVGKAAKNLGRRKSFLSGVWKKEAAGAEPVVIDEPPLEGLLGRRKTSSVVKSVFFEEFDELDKPIPKSSSRSSFLSAIGLPRLGKLSTRSYDGSLDHSNTVPKRKPPGFKLDLPKPASSPTRSVSERVPEAPGLWQSSQMENTEVMWHRAIRASIDARAMGIRKEFELVQPSPMTQPSMAFPKMPRRSKDKSLEDIEDDSEDDANETTHLSRKHSTHMPGNHMHTLEVPRLKFDRVGSQTIAFAQNALSEQLAIQGAMGPQTLKVLGSQSPISSHSPGCAGSPGSPSNARAQSMAQSRRLSKVSFTRPRTPPASWARFSSHDREQRCASAGAADKIVPTDFATIKMDDGTEVFVTGQRKHLHHHHEKESGHKHHASLPDRMAMKLRTSLDKLRTKQSTALNDAVLGRRSSTSAGGHLREPELELLPSLDIREMTETKLVEIEAEEMNRRKEREARMVGRLPSPHGSDGFQEPMTTSGPHEHAPANKPIGIGEARFYDDLVEDSKRTAFSIRSVRTFEEFGSADMMSDEERTLSKKSRFGTWSAKDRAKMALGSTERGGARMVVRELRKSTVDFEVQARLMEKKERERLLNAAEGLLENWSGGVGRGAWREV